MPNPVNLVTVITEHQGFQVGDRVRRNPLDTNFQAEGFATPLPYPSPPHTRNTSERQIGTITRISGQIPSGPRDPGPLCISWDTRGGSCLQADHIEHYPLRTSLHTTTESEESMPPAPVQFPVGARVVLTQDGMNNYGSWFQPATVTAARSTLRTLKFDGTSDQDAIEVDYRYIIDNPPEPTFTGDMLLGDDGVYRVSVHRDASTRWKLVLQMNLSPILKTIIGDMKSLDRSLRERVQTATKADPGATLYGVNILGALKRGGATVDAVVGEPECEKLAKVITATLDQLLAGIQPVAILMAGNYGEG